MLYYVTNTYEICISFSTVVSEVISTITSDFKEFINMLYELLNML